MAGRCKRIGSRPPWAGAILALAAAVCGPEAGAQLPAETATQVTGGLTVTGRFVPVGRAGVYVPGGLVAYPSSVVMNIVPVTAMP